MNSLSNATMSWTSDLRLENVTTSMLAVVAVATLAYVSVAVSVVKRSGQAYTRLLSNRDSVLQRDEVAGSMDKYDHLFDGARTKLGAIHKESSIKQREKEYQTLVNNFYNLVTDFYEYGWGQSFHFAPRKTGETFMESLKRSEHFLALKTGMGPGSKVLDVGCGVGGPMRNLHHFSGADITGVTINEYQVRVGNKYCKQLGIDHKCRIVQGDFQKLEEVSKPGQYDIAIDVEATPHSPDRVAAFSGVARALKPGGLFAGYDWVVLPDKGFDKNNKEHLRIKEGIEVGNGLPTLPTPTEIIEALEKAGFEVLEAYDVNENAHSEHEIPWYQTLDGSMTLTGFRMTRVGRICTHFIVSTLELLRIAPKGTARVSALLNATAMDLVAGGKKEMFTPSFFFLARKP